jgi:hypothetical protein
MALADTGRQDGAVATGPEAPELVGTWQLVSFERHAGGDVSYPMGRDARGYISYDPTGWMSVQIMRGDRAPLAGGGAAEGTLDELRATVAGYLGYAGTYTVDRAAGTVTHQIGLHLLPNGVGTTLVRRYEVAGDRLVLHTSAPGAPGGGRLTWQRVSPVHRASGG